MTNAATLVSTPGVSTPVVIHSIQVLSHSGSTARVSLTQPVWQGSVSTWRDLNLNPWSCVSNPWSYVGQPLLGLQRSRFRQWPPRRPRAWCPSHWHHRGGAAGQPEPRRRRRPDSAWGSVNWATPGPGSLHSKSKDWHRRRGLPGAGAAGPLTCSKTGWPQTQLNFKFRGLQSTSRSGPAIRIIARGQVQGALKISSPGAAGPQVPGPAIN